MHKFFVALFFIFSSNLNAYAADNIKIAAGVMSGAYYPVALQICSMVTKYSPVSKCDVVATSGSLNNLNLLASGKVDFAFVQSDIASDAYKGVGIFSTQKTHRDLRLVLNLFPEAFTMMVKDETGVRNFSDLYGKRIGINLRGAGSKTGLMTLFSYFKFDTVPDILQVSESHMASKLCDDEVDVVALFTGHPSGVASSIASKCDVEFINIDHFKLDALLTEHPVYEKHILEAGKYVNISKNAETFATRALLVGNSGTSRSKIDLVNRVILKNFDNFRASYPALNKLSKDSMFGTSVLPRFAD